MSKNIDKRVWGVLGKQQTYFSPQKQVQGKTKTPLNANAFDSWDAKRSRFKRVDGYENAVQQGGVVPQDTGTTPTPTPTITQTQTNTPTPSFTPTQTQTQTNTPSQTQTQTPSQTQTNTPTPSITPTFTPTPSTTPAGLSITPDLWYDSTNIGSIDYITSGGTDYVSAWRSVGNYSKTLTGATTDTMPVWSASTSLPGSPKIIRFNKNATPALRDVLSQRFDSTVITGEGITAFYVLTNPGLTYSGTGTANGFGSNFYLYSGNTTTGGFTPITPLINQPSRVFNTNVGSGVNTSIIFNSNSGITVGNTFAFSATNLNEKYLLTVGVPYPTGNPYVEINQSGATLTTPITGTPLTTLNSFMIGATVSSGGTLTAVNAGMELAEVMIYTRELTYQQQEIVQTYLRNKWRYSEWNLPNPVPTPTPSATPFNPTSLNPMIWVDFNDASTLSLRSGQFVQSVSNKGNWTAFTGFSQTTAANQPSWSASTMGTGMSAITISNDFLESTTIPTGSSWNSFAVLKYGGTDPFAVINVFSQFGAAQSWSNLYAQKQLDRYANFKIDGGFEYRRGFEGYTGFNTTHIAQGYLSNSALTMVDYFNVNNVAQTEIVVSNSNATTGYPGTITNSPLFRIINNEEFGTPIVGEIGEIYMFSKELTSTEQNNLINYLKTKWGIT